MKDRLPILLMVGGGALATISLGADLIGLGKAGIPAVQLLAAQAGILVLLAGMWLYIRQRQPVAETVESTPLISTNTEPVIIWILLGFLAAWFLCFIMPAVFNPEHKFRYFRDYMYEHTHIGYDVRLIMEHIRVWYTGERIAKYLFPPLTTLLFTPLLLLRYPFDYYLVNVITLISYPILNLLLPLQIKRGQSALIILFIFAISIYSYGLQFELTDGQFYTISMLLVMLAVYIFHRKRPYRIFAYLFFTLAIQLKITHAIFIFLFVDDWRDWKASLKRFGLIGLVNFLMLFLMGLPYLRLLLVNILRGVNSIEIDYNHSIEVFVRMLATTGYGLVQGSALEWIRSNVSLLQMLLLLYYLVCLGLAIYRTWKSGQRGIDLHLLMVCVIGSLMLPSISHDYKLPMLVAPFAMYFTGFSLPQRSLSKALAILLIFLASFAFSVTLFPSNARPAVLENSFPSLFMILTAVTLLGFIPRPQEAQGVSSNE